MAILSKRAQNLLNSLIEQHIKSGGPVSSKFLADTTNVSLSASTIRSVLAELESEGLVKSPHTSAGRVPTTQGYRYFINHLMEINTFTEKDMLHCKQQLCSDQNALQLLQTASSLLSDLTHFVGIVTLPKRNGVTLDHVEFLPLAHCRVLCVFVLSTGEIENRVITTDKPYTRSELEKVTNDLNTHFTGMSLEQLRQAVLNAMHSDKKEMDILFKTVLDVAEKSSSKEEYCLGGGANLLRREDAHEVSKARTLMDAFSQKNDILAILDSCLHSEGLQIFIGEESGHASLGGHSLVVSSYQGHNKVVGVLGVIGPTRMQYDRVIPIVNITAKLLSAAFNK